MSIVIKNMRWSNLFSYASDNYIDFEKNKLSQLVGSNGHGKSSIALILELGLFNKNSKGIKSANILNRYCGEKHYTIEINLSKYEDEYNIQVRRASTQTVKITKNGTDISGHTATQSFAIIEGILGFDHKTFCQLFYQSSAHSLEFLSATDTNRKKFLVEFLDLVRYTRAFEVFNKLLKEQQQEATRLEITATALVKSIQKNSAFDLTLKELIPQPEKPSNLEEDRAKIREDILRITESNKAIQNNNKYKELMDKIDISSLGNMAITDIVDTSPLVAEKADWSSKSTAASEFVKKLNSLKNVCPTCNHPIDNSKQLELLEPNKAIIVEAQEHIKILSDKILKLTEQNNFIRESLSKKSSWEQYHSLYDPTMRTQILDKNDLESTLLSVENKIKEIDTLITKSIEHNKSATAHNSKVEVIKSQILEDTKELEALRSSINIVADNVAKLGILVKAFSTNGLTAFKIESMIKDLEAETNAYLAELSYGKFQLSFVISGEKLDVVITDNGLDVDMSALSSGEKARVNTATLLAIRKIMQSLSKVKVNLLILDETIDNLDVEGKEKLIEILVGEEHLNIILVSHGYSHPLLEKIQVTKEDNISKVEQL